MAYARERRGSGAVQFGKLIRAWRGPDLDEWTQAAKQAAQKKGLDVYNAKSSLNALFAIREMPFRAYQSSARRFKVKTWSLRRLAHELGISKNTLEGYELGRHYPPIEFVYDLAAVLGIPSHQLVAAWLKHHPNPNVKAAEDPLARAVEFFRGWNRGKQPTQRNLTTIQFLTSALLYGLESGRHLGIARSELSKAACMASALVDYVLRLGLDPHPESLELALDNIEEQLQKKEGINTEPVDRAASRKRRK